MTTYFRSCLLALALAAFLISPFAGSPARADYIELKHPECHGNASAMYANLYVYHQYKSIAEMYLKLYKANPKIEVYKTLSKAYDSIAVLYLRYYWDAYYKFKYCELVRTVTYTVVNSSVRTYTVANGSVLTVTQYKTETKTATMTDTGF